MKPLFTIIEQPVQITANSVCFNNKHSNAYYEQLNGCHHVERPTEVIKVEPIVKTVKRVGRKEC